ncbi:MAG TPA: tRNA preQ1(34) S-adenosylmethionine ribosyltransferase-isomerase QueA [Anaerolineae bacterium]|nr:tRNA preQ1(34) S-adenosylmethionine ribosyltransferase-isomerase QueA [Anaerolineae bacterium]
MKTSNFDYELPPELIAQTPIEPRHASRLMVLHRATGAIEHRRFSDIGDYLRPGDLLVANDSRVIPARLHGRKVPTGGRVELLLLRRRDATTWEVLVGGRRVRVGTRLELVGPQGTSARVPLPRAEVIEVLEDARRLLRFERPIEPLLKEIGVVPLPPYIHEPLADAERYQTVYARIEGSVAAPTAGLHFTPELMEALQEQGVRFAFVTLHIGLDTFRPVQEEEIEEHPMHSEWCRLSPETAEAIHRTKAAGGRVIAVGTTAVRVLETAARERGVPAPFSGWTDLFITPGFHFRVVDGLITNFHLPRSTLLMLVSAFAGKELIDRAYQEAIRERYRFYSFGDAMFIE